MRKVKAPKEFLDFLEDKSVSKHFCYTAMGKLSTLFFEGGGVTTDFLVNNEKDIIDFLRGEVEFILEKQELFYIHLVKGEEGYVNIDKENGEIELTDKSETTYWKTKFTKEEVIQMNPSYVHFLEPVDNVEDEELDIEMPTDLGENPAKFFVFKKGSSYNCSFYNEVTSSDGHKRYRWDNTNETESRFGKYKTKFTLKEIKQFDLEFDEILLIPTIVDGEELINPYDKVKEKFYIVDNEHQHMVGDYLNLYRSLYCWNSREQTDEYQTKFSTEDLINIDPYYLNNVKFELAL